MKLFAGVAVVFLFAACTTSRSTLLTSAGDYKARTNPVPEATVAKMTFVADQKDYLPQMLGQWIIHTMKRQSQLPEESLNLYLHLNGDKTFTATSPCGNISGRYTVKGVSIRFEQVVLGNGPCEKREQMAEMIRLLTRSVSLYSYNGNMLFLKDNSGNNVFRVTR